MIVASPEAGAGRGTLDKAPPMPERTATRERNLMNSGRAEEVPASAGAGDPQVQALQAAQQIEQNLQKLVQTLPGTEELAAAIVSALRSTIADALAGTPGGQAGPQMGAPPPMMTPPPMGGMGMPAGQ